MTGLSAIVKKEFKCFGGDKGQIFIYTIMSAMWGLALFFNDYGLVIDRDAARLMFAFFAVIVAAGFSGTVFISERVTGTLEVLITSGISRDAVLFGKMIFVTVMATAVGLLCVGFAFFWKFALFDMGMSLTLNLSDAALYASTVYLNVAVSACLSVRMGNPRFLHLINLFITAGLLAVYSAISALFTIPLLTLIIVFLLIGALFTFLARREFMGERIIRPIIF